MPAFKELHMVARVIYTLVAVFTFWQLSGFTLYGSFLAAGLPVFMFSFMWQYYVIHFGLKGLSSPRGQAWFLIVWCIATMIGVFVGGMMIPSLDKVSTYASEDAFSRDFIFWTSVFTLSASAFVALTCARRAWKFAPQAWREV